MKKIAIIGTAGIPARYGGFETLVHHLVQEWKGKYDTTVYCSKNYYKSHERPKKWNDAKLIYLPFNANGAQSIIYDIVSMLHAIFYADVLLILGVSGGIAIPFIKLFTNKKIIVNIDGLEWRREKWGKLIQRFLKVSEYLAVKFSHADITDNAALKRYTAINYKTLSYMVAYGANHVRPRKGIQKDFSNYPFLKNKYAFKVCRIEPENNVHVILESFALIPEKILVVVGNWVNSQYGVDLKAKYKHNSNLILLDPIYEQKELDLLRSNCSLYIHGHSAGGTNPSLVEAMYLGLPIIAFDVIYNRSTMKDKGLYFQSSEDLRIKVIKTSSEQLNTLSKQMSLLANEFYTWEVIANKYEILIKSLFFNYKKTKVTSSISTLSDESLKELKLSHLKNSLKFYQKPYNHE
jgi:glycosyltransferase involved in cell wall biosynthesis